MNKSQFPRSLGSVLLAWVVALPLVGCKNEEQKAEIESLRQEIQDRDSNLAAIESRSAELDKKNAELDEKARIAEQKANQLENQLAQAKNELAVLQKSKAPDGVQTTAKNPSQALATPKAQLSKQLSAILMIEGDVTSGWGSVVQADGKTWLYTAAQVLSGNSKLTIKGADGAALTKLGGLQVAADANLVRLEIQQEMPVKFELDGKATVDTTTPLVAGDAGVNGAAPQIVDCLITRIGGNDFEFDANTLVVSDGCPLLSAESGKLIAIFSSGSAGAPPTLWPNAQQTTGSEQPRVRAARLNRTVEWKTASIASFLGERRKIDDLNKTTRLLYALAAVRVVGESLQLEGTLDGGNTTAGKVLAENATLPMVAELMKIQADLAGKKVGLAARDIKRRIASILGQAKSASNRQVQELKGILFASCHRPLAELALKWRAEADQALDASLATLSR